MPPPLQVGHDVIIPSTITRTTIRPEISVALDMYPGREYRIPKTIRSGDWHLMGGYYKTLSPLMLPLQCVDVGHTHCSCMVQQRTGFILCSHKHVARITHPAYWNIHISAIGTYTSQLLEHTHPSYWNIHIPAIGTYTS